MSTETLLQGGLEKNLPLFLSTADETDLYVAGTKYATFAGASVCNIHSSGVQVDFFHVDESSNKVRFHRVIVDANSTEPVKNAHLKLGKTEKIVVQAAQANVITVLPIVTSYSPNEALIGYQINKGD